MQQLQELITAACARANVPLTDLTDRLQIEAMVRSFGPQLDRLSAEDRAITRAPDGDTYETVHGSVRSILGYALSGDAVHREAIEIDCQDLPAMAEFVRAVAKILVEDLDGADKFGLGPDARMRLVEVIDIARQTLAVS